MNWTSFYLRAILTVGLVCILLYMAEQAVPMGSLVIFLLVTSIGITWMIINLLKDDDMLTHFFDED